MSDARDRYANVEVDYLLQRLEAHDGCVVLATNLESNVDDAFRRRIDAAVDFPRPDEAARRAIWASIFPDETPTGALDVDFLAGFELTGGYIRNVATTAAFLAAEDGVGRDGTRRPGDGRSEAGDGRSDTDDANATVEMAHVVRALRREFQKTGKLFESSIFGEYQEALR